MKIQYKKIETEKPWGEKAREILPQLHLIENDASDNTHFVLDLYVSSKRNAAKTYLFTVEPEATSGTILGLMNDITAALFSKTIEGIDENDADDVLRSVNIATGLLADKVEEERNAAPKFNKIEDVENFDGNNKVVFHMLDGSILYADFQQFAWGELVDHPERLYQTINNIQQLIHLLISQKTVKAVGATEELDVNTLVDNQIEMFYKMINDFGSDYSIYENSGIATEREIKIAKLFDMLTFYNEQLRVVAEIRTHNNIIQQLSKGPSEEEIKAAQEAVDKAEEEQLVQDAEPVEAEELPAEE